MFVSHFVWKADQNNYSTIKIVVECFCVDLLIIVSLSYVPIKKKKTRFELVICLNHFNNYTKQASWLVDLDSYQVWHWLLLSVILV